MQVDTECHAAEGSLPPDTEALGGREAGKWAAILGLSTPGMVTPASLQMLLYKKQNIQVMQRPLGILW